MNLLIGPYFPPEVATSTASDGSGGSGARRRLAAWVGEAVSLRDAGAGGLPAGTPELVVAEAQGELVRRVKTLLSKPKFTLARRSPGGYRRLLLAPPEEEPVDTGSSAPGQPELPQLKVGRQAVGAGRTASPLGPRAVRWASPVLPHRLLGFANR